MSLERCSHCDEDFGYEPGWDDPPKGEGHIEALWNPADEPDFVVGEKRIYCSAECLLTDFANPFSPAEDETPDPQDTDTDHSGGGA